MENKDCKVKERLQQLQTLVAKSRTVERRLGNLVIYIRDPVRVPEAEGLTPDLAINRITLDEIFGPNKDLIRRDFTLAAGGVNATLYYVEGLVDKSEIERHIITPLVSSPGLSRGNLLDAVRYKGVTAGNTRVASKVSEVVDSVLSGETALIIDGHAQALIVSTRGWEKRGIKEPETELSVRGPREGFTETLRTSTSLIRRYCRDVNLVLESLQVGARSKTDTVIAYIRDIADPGLVDKVKQRLEQVTIDGIQFSGQLESFLEDAPWSPFPQTLSTERPDKAVSALLEGRVVILVDGTPFALILPATLPQFMQAADDYMHRWMVASLIRITRYIGAFISTVLPALYVALITYNVGLIPTSLALTLQAARQAVPFPAFIEAVLMEMMLELLQEAGLRLPRPVGQAISIVGGLVIGEAAVRAGLISPLMVIVIAATAIASYVIPNYDFGLSLRFIRLFLIILAGIAGFYGLMLGFMLIVIHLCDLYSFGEPYLGPLAPFDTAGLGDWRDTFVRLQTNWLKHRPRYLEPIDKRRQKT